MKTRNQNNVFASSLTTVLTAALLMMMSLTPVQAATLAGITMADTVTLDGKTLVLNGLGVRAATFMKVKVYIIGLYLENKSSDAKAIITSDQLKRIEMHFVHDVSAEDIREGWSEAFENNYKDAGSIGHEISKFNASMQDMETGDSIVLEFSAGVVNVLVKGNKVDSIEGEAFQQAALSIWLGKKPPNKELKTGILGN